MPLPLPCFLIGAAFTRRLDAQLSPDPLLSTVLLAALALAPFAGLMLTSFSKIAVVLSTVRSALGTQHAPPTLVLTGLALVLSAHVMAPVLEASFAKLQGVNVGRPSWPELGGAVSDAAEPWRAFLLKHAGEEERRHFLELSHELRGNQGSSPTTDESLAVLVPAFLVTELKEAFQIGFVLFLPFLVLDMVIANLLLALGMQTLSPTQVALPFKLLLFVAVDGWTLLSRALVLGYR